MTTRAGWHKPSMDFSQGSVTVLPHRALKEENEFQSTVHYATMCLLLMVSVTTKCPQIAGLQNSSESDKKRALKIVPKWVRGKLS